MTRPAYTTQDIIHVYTQTPATVSSLAARYHVRLGTIRQVLTDNLAPATFSRLKAQKMSRGLVRANLARYRAEHGL